MKTFLENKDLPNNKSESVFNLIIPGCPISDTRPRFLKSGIVYDPRHQEKKHVKTTIKLLFNDFLRIEGNRFFDQNPLHVNAYFFFPIPKSFTKKKTNIILNEKNVHTVKPDLDNLLKFYLDCCKDIVFYDDKTIVSLNSKKMYALTPYTQLEFFNA